MSKARPVNLHATAIVLGDCGILIRGAARSGKSALALSTLQRAASAALPAALIADDQVFVAAAAGVLTAFAPAATRGLIEVSGVGILTLDSVPEAELRLLVELAPIGEADRLPEALSAMIEGVRLRRMVLPPQSAAFGADVLITLAQRGFPGDDLNRV